MLAEFGKLSVEKTNNYHRKSLEDCHTVGMQTNTNVAAKEILRKNEVLYKLLYHQQSYKIRFQY